MSKPEDQPVPAEPRFKVGDKVRNVHAAYLPTATVTEITELGFKYVLDRPMMISPRLGTQTGGESYDDAQWELVPVPEGGEPNEFAEHVGVLGAHPLRDEFLKELGVPQPSAPEPSSDARKVAREIVESYFMYSDRLLDKNALIDRITTALTSTRSELLKQIREAVSGLQIEPAMSFERGYRDGINDALAAIDKVAKETTK